MAAAAPGAALTKIPGAGHISNLEAPDAFNAALSAWLDRAAAGKS
jgi:pimeloyl-ACP methyl ester carboxylesterase